MITYIFRKRTTGFSIEKLFDALYEYSRARHIHTQRLEVPHISSGVWSVIKNAWYVRRRVNKGVLHITGDVHYAALLHPFMRTVITIHDLVILQRGGGFRKFVFWLLWFRLPLSLADEITVISEQTRRELLAEVRLPEHKVHVIPNFVSADYRHIKKEFNTQATRVLHVGTSPNKNLPRVIAALSGLPVVLVIVGPLHDDILKSLHEANLSYEHHVGPSHQQLLALYQNADLISFPSTYEGFGMPILEGQASGRPVLTSDAEPMRSVAGAGGALLIDPLSVAAIRTGFLALIRDSNLRESLVDKGLINCQQYTLEAIATRYEQLYTRLCERLHA